MKLNWGLFASRVHAGRTQARHRYGHESLGIVMENKPDVLKPIVRFQEEKAADPDYDTSGYNASIRVTWLTWHGIYAPNIVQTLEFPADILEYLVDGEWRNFYELALP